LRHPEDRNAIEAAAAGILDDIDLASSDDPDRYGPDLHVTRTAGFVRVALRLGPMAARCHPASMFLQGGHINGRDKSLATRIERLFCD
jgi:hypothetical protein